MNVTCPNCATVYRVDPVKVPEAGVRARCTVCSAVFAVRRESALSAPSVAAHAGPQRAPAGGASTSSVPSPQPTAPAPQVSAAASPAAREPDHSRAESVRPHAPAASPPAAPAAATRSASLPPPAVPATGPRPAGPSRPAAPAGPAAPAATPAAPSPPPAATPGRSPQASPPGRPVNPFLSQDPALKARRLARALISDMVVYHPVKRQEGLRDGTLKQLFEDEIKKSWEEFSDQVGREVAESTSYFKEALNEILAGGRQIF
jgi:predicted Zn finger-like uncharacterized protein